MRSLFRFFSISIVIISSFLSVVSASPVLAHDLMPFEIVEYLENNPGASIEKIRAYIAEQGIDFDTQYYSAKDLFDMITAPDPSFLKTILDFIKLGVQHILNGIDHILFILALLLAFESLRRILKLTITFTIAHSITIILAGSGLLTLSSRIVEPFIAFSIGYVAITTVFLKKTGFFKGTSATIASIFFFGLFHGLGFAGILKDVSIPKNRFLTALISFNIGIEFGQLLIVTASLPFIYYASRQKWYPQVIRFLALIIAGISIYWGIERIISYA